MNILVTGGAGFIGSHTVVELVNAGYNPIIIDNFNNSEHFVIKRLEAITSRPIKVYEFDYADIPKTKQVLINEDIAAIIHFAAYKQVEESVKEPLKYYQNNVAGLVNFLKLINDLGKASRFVFSSSCTVYGEPDKLPVSEESPTKPAISPYGSSKQMAETIIRDLALSSPHLGALSLRYFNPIGAHPSSLIGELPKGVPANLVPYITQAAAGLRDSLTVFGDDYPTTDGSCVRDYIHVVDLAKAHVQALNYLETKPAGFYDVFNIGTGQGSSVLEVIKTFETVSGVKLNYKIGPKRQGDVISTYASVNKANKLLGWKAEKSLADALIDAWHWQQNIPTDLN